MIRNGEVIFAGLCRMFRGIALISNIVLMTVITSFIAGLADTGAGGDIKSRAISLAGVAVVCFTRMVRNER